MKKRLFTAMLAAVLALSALAGCSAGKEEDGTAAGQAGGHQVRLGEGPPGIGCGPLPL